jgi:signal transduction histidine kinase
MIAIITYMNYKRELEHFDKELLSKMQLCSYSLDCPEFEVAFVPKAKQLTYTLIKDENETLTLFPIEGGDEFYLKLFYSKEQYHTEMHFLHKNAFFHLFLWLLVILCLSVLFSFYALYPLRNALHLTREFVKDILHDFNTPISTMRLNLSLLHREMGENKKLSRVERSIENILLLQENLREYLHATKCEPESIELLKLIEERVHLIEQNYSTLSYDISVPEKLFLYCEKNAFSRIIDNLLSNASKYNKPNGEVKIIFDEVEKSLAIKDKGKGIKNPKKVFQRFYKEHERGVGIGLHIVEKLCIELDIKIKLISRLNEGTTVILSLAKIINSKIIAK